MEEKIEFNEEQLKALGIEVSKKSVFDRVSEKGTYYYIEPDGDVGEERDIRFVSDDNYYAVANYCTDKALMEQRALHETLDRLLWRFSMEHDGDKIDWNAGFHYGYWIMYNNRTKTFLIEAVQGQGFGTYFYSQEIAELAIKEIIKPFMAKHPEFKW